MIATEEPTRGWPAAVAKERDAHRHVFADREPADLFRFFAGVEVVPVDNPVATRFDRRVAGKVRIGTTDLTIAATALVRDALLLTANRQGFEKIPGLRFENWMDG